MDALWCDRPTMNIKIKTKELLAKHADDIERINHQRRLWLYASSVVMVGIVGLIFSWDWVSELHSKSVWWVIVSVMLIISINWWYWTMSVIRRMLDHQKVEYDLLSCILNDISLAKEDIKFLVNQEVDSKK
jgi:hypothetical protein